MQILSITCPALAAKSVLPLLENHSILWNEYFLQYIQHPAFQFPRQGDCYIVYIGSLAEFGLDQPSTFPQISTHIKKAGYTLPPAHLGISLRLALQKQKPSTNSQLSGQKTSPQGAIVLLSAPLEANIKVPRSLYLRNVDGQLWLRGSVFDDLYEFPGNTLVAFVRETVAPQNFQPGKKEAFYKARSRYPDCVLDYLLLQSSNPHQGLPSHKDALVCAINELRHNYNRSFTMDESLLCAIPLSPTAFFAESTLDETRKSGLTSYNPPEEFSYHYAFCHPPTSRPLPTKAFAELNWTLFPHGTEHLEIFEWAPNFSNYFDAGLEYWGAAMWTVYDRLSEGYVVIGASGTD